MHENQDAQSSQRISFGGFFRKSATYYSSPPPPRPPYRNPWVVYPTILLVTSGTVWFAYKPIRHSVLATVRCYRVVEAACLGVIDYKITFTQLNTKHPSEDDRLRCEIALGQHLGSLLVLPREWTSTMKPLQDKCEPTPYEDVEALFRSDMGAPVSDLFDEFDSIPIGVASLAQVHVGRDRKTGKRVAVKLQHPHLAEFCDIDMAVVESSLGWIKYWFPEFEFTWLAEEMRTNLPLEMDFCHEAANSEKTREDFRNIRDTTLYIPEVLSATKRVLVMEYIEGCRPDDLAYLAQAHINRNQVALEIAKIFNQMVLLHGCTSRSPFNFEIVLLDHGQLRVNYSKLWLSLIAPASPATSADRRKYATSSYPIFEAALTGRAVLEGSWEHESSRSGSFRRGSGLIDIAPQSEKEKEALRNAVAEDGMLMSVLDVLRRVPRRILMILKLNDLTRSLDHALMTTHSNTRIFLVSAKYCATAVWHDDRRRIINKMHDRGFLTVGILVQYLQCWWTVAEGNVRKFQKIYSKMVFLEQLLDIRAFTVKSEAWIRGLAAKGYMAHRMQRPGSHSSSR
ncbi:ABC1 family-domain-containing protein [Mycena galopus ATCC 62051]|nr:ABC1 family-domain-containing protein [Mycena galopus ATCC 62051]